VLQAYTLLNPLPSGDVAHLRKMKYEVLQVDIFLNALLGRDIAHLRFPKSNSK
jgi:hypothetical protein